MLPLITMLELASIIILQIMRLRYFKPSCLRLFCCYFSYLQFSWADNPCSTVKITLSTDIFLGLSLASTDSSNHYTIVKISSSAVRLFGLRCNTFAINMRFSFLFDLFLLRPLLGWQDKKNYPAYHLVVTTNLTILIV